MLWLYPLRCKWTLEGRVVVEWSRDIVLLVAAENLVGWFEKGFFRYFFIATRKVEGSKQNKYRQKTFLKRNHGQN